MRSDRRQRLGVALFPLGALAIHQLRYEPAFGSDASREPAAHGHGYLQALTPLVVLVASLGAASRPGREATTRPPASAENAQRKRERHDRERRAWRNRGRRVPSASTRSGRGGARHRARSAAAAAVVRAVWRWRFYRTQERENSGYVTDSLLPAGDRGRPVVDAVLPHRSGGGPRQGAASPDTCDRRRAQRCGRARAAGGGGARLSPPRV
jgi:hypothetical protein